MSVGSSRRTFLACGAALAGAGLAGVLAPSAAAATARATLRRLALRRSAFLPLLGQTFRISHGAGTLPVTLLQVSDLKPSVRPDAERQFSLIFTGAAFRPVLSQGTYSVSHARRGQISVFVVPVGMQQTAQQYQVIVDSRPLSAFRE